ncbi:hypothetical protein EON66_00520 [archaeon]|nr:MAG: hypothetical protein EON66_00520 [archaeon]
MLVAVAYAAGGSAVLDPYLADIITIAHAAAVDSSPTVRLIGTRCVSLLVKSSPAVRGCSRSSANSCMSSHSLGTSHRAHFCMCMSACRS